MIGDPVRCLGIGREPDNDKAVIVYFSEPLTDDQLRFFHDTCERTAYLLPEGADNDNQT